MSVKSREHEGHQKCIKNMQARENEFKKVRAELEQKIQFLQEELKEYQEREQNNKKINESIMITYEQNENIREEHVNKQIHLLTAKHQNQLRKIKQINEKQTRLQEETINEYKAKYEQSLIEIDRRNVECEKRILDMKKKFEAVLKKQLQEKENEMESKMQILIEKLKQSEGMAQLYKQWMEKKRTKADDEEQNYSRVRRQSCGYKASRQQSLRKLISEIENEPPSRSSRRSRIKETEYNLDDRRRSASRQSVKLLTVRIDRTLTQLKKSNNLKLHERINQKLSKRL